MLDKHLQRSVLHRVVYPHCLGSLPAAAGILQKRLNWERVSLVHNFRLQPIMVGKPQGRTFEAGDHITVTVEQRTMDGCMLGLSLLLHLYSPGFTHSLDGSSHNVTKLPHTHAQRPISQATLESAMSVIGINHHINQASGSGRAVP